MVTALLAGPMLPQVRQVGMTDARRAAGGRASVVLRLQEERRLLRSTLWELLVTHAPGARR